MIYYIYLVTNLINQKKYIGMRSYDGNDILKDKYMGSGLLIKSAINKYGKENFKKEILEICIKENIGEREAFYIEKHNAVNDENYYNIAEGGRGGKVLQEYPTGEKHHSFNTRLTESAKKKISLANKGKKRTEEHCERMRKLNKGKRLSQKNKIILLNSRKGKTNTEEHNLKIAESNRMTKAKQKEQILVTKECVICGKSITNTPSQVLVTCSKECFKILQSIHSKGENNGMYGKHITDKCREIISKKTYVTMENGEILSFNSQKECAEYFKVGMSTVSAWKRDERKEYMRKHKILTIK